MSYVKKGSLFVPTRNLWVPKRGVDWKKDERGFISIPQIGAIAGSRRRSGGLNTFSDDFTRANANPISNPSSSGGTWGTVTYSGVRPFKIVSNQSSGRDNGEQNMVQISSPTFHADQKISATLVSVSQYGGIAVRCQSLSDPSGYMVYVNANAMQVIVTKGNQAGSSTNLVTLEAGEWVSGDILTLEATGTSSTDLKVYKNGVQYGSTYTDSSSPYTSGQPGLYTYLATAAHSSYVEAEEL